MSNDEFFSFDEALSELRLKEEELKRLVSEGEIRAFREGETMKLRKGDVEALRDDLGGSGLVDLGDSGEEIVFEDDVLADEAGMATEEISDVDTIIEDEIEDVGEIEIDDQEPAKAAAVRRSSARAAAGPQEEAKESMGVLVACVVTSLIMILSVPLVFSVSSGETSGIAEGIAKVFFPESFE